MKTLKITVLSTTVHGSTSSHVITKQIQNPIKMSKDLVLELTSVNGSVVTYNTTVEEVNSYEYIITVLDTTVSGVTHAPIFIMGAGSLFLNKNVVNKIAAPRKDLGKGMLFVTDGEEVIGSSETYGDTVCGDVYLGSPQTFDDVKVESIKAFGKCVIMEVSGVTKSDRKSKIVVSGYNGLITDVIITTEDYYTA